MRSTLTHVFNNSCRGAGAAPVYEPLDGRTCGRFSPTLSATFIGLSRHSLCIQSRIQASPSSTSLLAHFCLVTAGEDSNALRQYDYPSDYFLATKTHERQTRTDNPLQQTPIATFLTTAPSVHPVQLKDNTHPLATKCLGLCSSTPSRSTTCQNFLACWCLLTRTPIALRSPRQCPMRLTRPRPRRKAMNQCNQRVMQEVALLTTA
jgi:hypothetical protein